ncbi:MAG TPA: asparagine synthase (glutamine-hydrolyzing) [Firmicutes bacterium]|nr:asparagine synthase (glutamine-hydrolyzing) [Bacillota bacterium]
MCGIFGIIDYNRNYSRETLKKAADTLVHRGPDDEGYLISPPAFFGHRRLSIIDLQTGHQPIFNEDESICILFNGEIYNFHELDFELKSKGHVFKSKSDTETIIHLYEEKGEDFINYLRGMFSLALWDSKEEKLILARDRMGQKPLFYLLGHGKIIFSSELKAILTLPEISREIDTDSLLLYLSLQYVPAPLSIFKDIQKLEPANYLVFQNGELKSLKRYWHPVFYPKSDISFNDACSNLLTLTKESVRLRLISDVPLGAFLSGGIDSGIIVALMSELSGSPVKTFSIGFNEPGYDEVNYARLIADRYKTEHHEFIVTPNAAEIFEDLVYYYNEPFADSSAIPTYYVSKLTREHVTVALNGDGGDESFGGYRRYVAARLFERFSGYPDFVRDAMISFGRIIPVSKERGTGLSRVKRFLELMKKDPFNSYRELMNHFSDDMLSKLLKPEFLNKKALTDFLYISLFKYLEDLDPEADFIDKVMYLDQMTYLPNDLLVKVDIAGMMNSLECRSPFLDHKIVEFAASLPAEFKIKGNCKKRILKHTFREYLPPEIINRGKMGFGVPINRWFRNELKDFVRDHLLSKSFYSRGYFNFEYVNRMINEHQENRSDYGYQLWNLLFLKLWFDKWQ